MTSLTTDAQQAAMAIYALVTDPDGRWLVSVSPQGVINATEAPPTMTPPPSVASPLPTVGTTSAMVVEVSLNMDNGTQTPPPVPSEPTVLMESTAPIERSAPIEPVSAAPTETTPAPRRSFITSDPDAIPATEGWRGKLASIGIKIKPSEREIIQHANIRAVSQQWPGPRTIVIVNGKGGTGKTPTTICLSAVFARYGGSGVLAWDNNQTRGTLGWRTEQGPHQASISDLLPQVERLLSIHSQAADLSRYVHHQTSDRYDVLRSRPDLLPADQRLTPADVDSIWQVATKYYRLVLIDSGNDESDPLWARMIDHADQLVIATTTREDHAEAGALLLEALGERDQHSAQLARDAVVIVSQADKGATRQDVDALTSEFNKLVRVTASIPYDQAMVKGQLAYTNLHSATQQAWLAAAAAVARGL